MEKKIKPHVRETALTNGMAYPSDTELVMLLLGSGTQKKPVECLADEVLKTIDRCNPPEWVQALLQIEGIGTTKALTIAAALELGRRLNRTPHTYVHDPADCVPYVQHYALKSMEHFLCISLNGAREILSIHVVSVGATNIAVVEPRDVFGDAIKNNASAAVLCHNHPSGVCEPSQEDVALTKHLVRVAAVLGIVILDHIILTRKGYFSFLEHGMLPIPTQRGSM